MKEFDWAGITRNEIIQIFIESSVKFKMQHIPVLEFHKSVTTNLKRHIPIRTKKNFIPNKLDAGQVAISGFYHPEYDEENKIPIELVFFYHGIFDQLKLSQKRIANIGALMADTILHEIIHMSQHRKKDFLPCPSYVSCARNGKIKEQQQYLGKFDEIDAYAFNIVDELADRFGPDRPKILAYINSNQQDRRQKVNSWLLYIRAFEYNHTHPVIRRLKKRIVKYLDRMHTGRPYDVNPWLTPPK
jgi:hypothetical protein